MLLACGVPESTIGVISPYRAQLKLLSQKCRRHASVDIYTVDRYQGRDKECILLSMVRSNDSMNIGELLKDWRRVNVAFTRAKSKLIIFGSKSTLESNPLYENLIQLLQRHNWVSQRVVGDLLLVCY